MYFSFNQNRLPHITYMNKTTTPKQWVHPKRTTKDYILFIILSGKMYLQEDNVRYTLCQNDYIFLQPGHTHWGYKASPCEYYYIHFQADCLHGWDCEKIPEIVQLITDNNKLLYSCDPFSNELYDRYKLFVPKDMHLYSQNIAEQITVHMNQAIHIQNKQSSHFKLSCSSLFIEILILISRDFVTYTLSPHANSLNSKDTHKVYSLIDYIHTNYADTITGTEISEMFHVNYDSFNRLFKQETGFTIFHYIKHVRLTHARELLSTTQLKLSEISEMTGFCDQYYFSRVFKEAYGTSPKKYRS